MRLDIKKNLLDLQYSKQLQYFTTALITLLTYLVGVSIALLTKQINFISLEYLIAFIALSFFVFSFTFGSMFVSTRHMRRIFRAIEKLDKSALPNP